MIVSRNSAMGAAETASGMTFRSCGECGPLNTTLAFGRKRDQRFESHLLRQRVRLSRVPRTLSAKVAAIAPVRSGFGT